MPRRLMRMGPSGFEEVPLTEEFADIPSMSDMCGDMSNLSMVEAMRRIMETDDRIHSSGGLSRRQEQGGNGIPTCSHPGCTETHGLVPARHDFDTADYDSDDSDVDVYEDYDAPDDDGQVEVGSEDGDKAVRGTAERIFSSWNDLKAVLDQNEDKIRKRWTKKTTKARREMLLQALPWMAKHHRPDFRAFRSTGGDGFNGRNKNIAAYGLPHINLEDLSRPRNLLLLLESRGRHSPDSFFPVEWRACQLYRESRMLKVTTAMDRVLVFNECEGPSTYGISYNLTDDEVDGDMLESGRAVPFMRGFFVMDCQDVLYRFLLDISLLIIGEKEVPESTNETILKPFPMPPHADLGSPVAAAAESMYLAPAKINLDRLIDVVHSALKESEDHIIFLREDPGYYYEHMMDCFTHRQEHIIDQNGKKHPALQADNRGVWEPVIRNATRMPFIWLESWAAIHERLVALRAKQQTYAHLLAIGDIPDDYALDICKLKCHCSRFMSSATKALKHGFYGSPPMRPLLKRVPPLYRDAVITLAKGINVRNENAKFLVFLIDMTIAVAEKQDERDFMLAMDEIQRLIEDEKVASDMITSWVLHQLSQASILSQCIHELDLAYPYKMPAHEDEIKEDFFKTVDAFIEDGDVKILDNKLLQLAMPTTNPTKFAYPINKRRTRENVEQMRRAEANLDIVWKAMDHELSRYPVFTPRVRELLATRRKERTLPWDESRDGKQQATMAVDDSQPLSDIHFELQSRTERTLSRAPRAPAKSKEKTKGTASGAMMQPEQEATTPEAKEVSFSVDKRALKALRTIFFVPSASSLPGEVAWTDFCHALTSTGFAAEKMYGSVWQFTPKSLDVENPISFHEPHPSNRIPFVVARRHGRRLARNYGWHIGMFKLKET